MPANPDPGLLDDPVWHALTGPHRRFATSVTQPARAYRYPVDVAPFGALRDADDGQAWAELAELSGPDGRAALEAPDVVGVPQGWTVVTVFPIAQMIAPSVALAAASWTDSVVPLDKRDAAEMVKLAELTRPGPFSLSTVELGGYLGVRRGRQLVAMAGRRMHLPGWIEISAVCTHPDHRGQGLSRLLMAGVEAAIRQEGQRAFLHVLHENTRAISLYRGLGFTVRAEMAMTVVRPVG
ncbi:GNAT family N-acetyltransferase [Mycobacterium sp.]|uniref:GNAT family N-acetyltransferase n=1 Tax=Mycobacterium sp. TaxID=1785 RepID=UPI0025DE8030|nr:GNAT family N-acetyltransferase [Mycobacterium sp.]